MQQEGQPQWQIRLKRDFTNRLLVHSRTQVLNKMKHDFREKSEKKEAITAKKLARLNEKEEDLKEKETTRKLSRVETSPEEIVDLQDWGEQHKCWRKQKVNKKGGPKRWKRSKRLWMTIFVPTYKWVQKGGNIYRVFLVGLQITLKNPKML